MTKEHRDYVLMKELYHCTPKELDEQDNTTSLEEKLADLRKYASVIIYEE